RFALRGGELKHDTFRSREIDRFAETVINRPHDPVPVGAHPITHSEQLCFSINVKCDVLHHARGDWSSGPGGMGNALYWVDFTNLGSLNELHRRTIPHFDKTVEGIFHSVHPIKCDEFHPAHLCEEVDLLFDVLGADREVMNTVWQAHKNP